jgi:hypothetical protein
MYQGACHWSASTAETFTRVERSSVACRDNSEDHKAIFKLVPRTDTLVVAQKRIGVIHVCLGYRAVGCDALGNCGVNEGSSMRWRSREADVVFVGKEYFREWLRLRGSYITGAFRDPKGYGVLAPSG